MVSHTPMKCMNPVIYFDELDKVSDTHKGEEIIHLLTHLTDPSQNSLFQDNYFPGIQLYIIMNHYQKLYHLY